MFFEHLDDQSPAKWSTGSDASTSTARARVRPARASSRAEPARGARGPGHVLQPCDPGGERVLARGPARRSHGGRRRRRRQRRGRAGSPAGAGRRVVVGLDRRPEQLGEPGTASVITRAPLATASKSRLETNPSARMSSWWSLRTTPAPAYAAASWVLGRDLPRTSSSGTRPSQRSPYTPAGGRRRGRRAPPAGGPGASCPRTGRRARVPGSPASGWKRSGSVAWSRGVDRDPHSRARRTRRAAAATPVVAAGLVRGDVAPGARSPTQGACSGLGRGGAGRAARGRRRRDVRWPVPTRAGGRPRRRGPARGRLRRARRRSGCHPSARRPPRRCGVLDRPPQPGGTLVHDQARLPDQHGLGDGEVAGLALAG